MSEAVDEMAAPADSAAQAAQLFASLDESTMEARPGEPSLSYRFGLGLLVVALLVLVAIYPVIILATFSLLVWYAVQASAIFSEPGNALLHAAAYFVPLFAGLIFLFFLAKPLFARRHGQASSFSLSRADAPLLFAFIGRICRLTNAPPPSRVDVNCDVNASASFRAGLRSLFGNDVVLTIGLPLAAGLNMGEFGGVLAHEFAHFAQGAGMRLTFLVRSINFWFARVVYERDAWDWQLDQAAALHDWRFIPIIQPARAGIWLTRRILWLLMQVSHALSCFMLRQMEFAADQWQSRMAGWDAFESTMRKVRLLGAAHEHSKLDLNESWKARRLPNHLPAFILHKQTVLGEEFAVALDASLASGRTRLFDTHPSPADRVAAARNGGEPGIFRVISPATELFSDFDTLSRNATRFHYECELRLPLSEQSLVDLEQTQAEAAQTNASDDAMRRYFGNSYSAIRPLFLMAHETEPGDGNDARRRLVEARTAMLDGQGYAGDLLEEFTKHDRQLQLWTKAASLIQGGFTFDPTSFQLTECSHLAATQAKGRANLRQKQLANDLEPFEASLRLRLCSALRLVPELAAAQKLPAEWISEIPPLIKVLARFGEFHRSLVELRGKMEGFQAVLENGASHPSPERVHRFLSSLGEDLSATAAMIRDRCRDVAYPFPHARGSISLSEYSRNDVPFEGHYEGSLRDYATLLDRLFSLHYRVLSRLVAIAEQVEGVIDSEDLNSACPPS